MPSISAFVHKRTGMPYKQIANCEMKDPETGRWRKAVIYQPWGEQTVLYVREAADFQEKFEIQPWPPKGDDCG